jgi:hypothetical protein
VKQGTPQSGSYTANLLGNIRSHLAGLQGFDVMALELLQNADDAKATFVRFDISEEGLSVSNSGEFTYCGDLGARPCRLHATQNYSCDFHRIADVGSGGKLARAENIGRFGIGFVSTYQVTDHPEIESAGIHLTLLPERGQWELVQVERREGTTFFLPWAFDPTSEGRTALGVSHIASAHIEQLAEDFTGVLKRSLLFLRHVRKAEVWRDGRLLLGCDLERGTDDELIVSLRPAGDVEQWLILRTDASEAAAELRARNPQLDALKRGTGVSIAIRVEPVAIEDGVLYAFLPTEQLTGLPLHINADFFPESDRKAIIFAGHQHQQAWNEMLIAAAAIELARHPEKLVASVGHVQYWQLLRRAYELARAPGHPGCFQVFWEKLKESAPAGRIVRTLEGALHLPSDVFIPRVDLTASQASAFRMVGGRLASEELRPFQVVMGQLGAPILTLERFVNLLEAATATVDAGVTQVNAKEVQDFYAPIWDLTEALLPEGGTHSAEVAAQLKRLCALPIVVTEDRYVVTIGQSYLPTAGVDGATWAGLLRRMAVASKEVARFSKLARLFTRLNVAGVAKHLKSMLSSDDLDQVINTQKDALRSLYASLADLDRIESADAATYETLRGLPIWATSSGLVAASRALLPGNFNDPTGHASLLDGQMLNESARHFASVRLRVPTQDIRAYVLNVLPAFFQTGQPSDPGKYPALIRELASHVSLMNDDDTRQVLSSLPLLPSRDGGWARPADLYRRTEELVRVLGDTQRFWLDNARLPAAHSVQMFVDSLGIRRTPVPTHLSWRMIELASSQSPGEDAVKASAEAFYVLCDQYAEWHGRSSYVEAISLLKTAECFPADGEDAGWYRANALYAPFRADAFKSQAKILGFRNTGRLVTDLLKDLGVRINPETSLVIGHLQNCIRLSQEPHFSTYQILNERAATDPLVGSLSGVACIYVGGARGFARPDQVYWTPQRLGKYAYTIPVTLEAFRPLFTALGVKNSPEGADYAKIWLDVVGEHFESGRKLSGPARSVYDACVTGVAEAFDRGDLGLASLSPLKEAPSILNVDDVPTYPDEVLIQDSEWHAGFFNGELNRALCRPAPEHKALLASLGVRRLTENASVQLEYTQGLRLNENEFAAKLVERVDVLLRLLHDRPGALRKSVREAVVSLGAVSYEQIRIQASVMLAGEHATAAPVSASAYFDSVTRTLVLARPVADRSWPQALNAVFHQLMPEASGSEVSSLTLSFRPLLGLSIEDAHRELTEAGVPFFEPAMLQADEETLVSDDLGALGSASASGDESGSAPEPGRDGNPKQPLDGSTVAKGGEKAAAGESEKQEPDHDPARSTTGPGQHPPGQGERKSRSRASRPKFKEQWDRRLLSYVRRREPESSASETEPSERSEHNLAVEAVARDAVCKFERERGRVPVPMPQTHPGYDIVSRDPITGEERFIEVKGISGEWNQTGVGLSRLQFSNAQDLGDSYWLYVIEFVSEPANIRVHPIQSPASQVTAFMFDGNWRGAAIEDVVDPAAAFIPGARVKHQHFGLGEILSMETRGATRVMSVKFESAGTRTVTLNLQTMSVAQENADNLS